MATNMRGLTQVRGVHNRGYKSFMGRLSSSRTSAVRGSGSSKRRGSIRRWPISVSGSKVCSIHFGRNLALMLDRRELGRVPEEEVRRQALRANLPVNSVLWKIRFEDHLHLYSRLQGRHRTYGGRQPHIELEIQRKANREHPLRVVLTAGIHAERFHRATWPSHF